MKKKKINLKSRLNLLKVQLSKSKFTKQFIKFIKNSQTFKKAISMKILKYLNGILIDLK